MVGTRRGLAVLISGLLVIIAGCSGPPGGGASAPAGGGGGGGGAGNLSSIDVCALLTPAEIQTSLGSAMTPGVKKATSSNSADCTWEAVEATAGLSVEVQITPFDQGLWDSETHLGNETAVPGVGDEAVKGFVSQGVLLIKHGGMEVDLTIVAIFLDQAKVDAGQVSLGKLVISRL